MGNFKHMVFYSLTVLADTYKIYLQNGMQNDFKLLAVVEWLVLLIGFVAFLFFVTLITYASALIHGGGKIISIKDLLSLTARSLKTPLITYFYFTLLSFGYLALCFYTLLPIWLLLGVAGFQIDWLTISAILYTIPATVLFCYLSIVWNISLVSILEENFGMEALGKAEQIVKGMKLQGFILNLLLNITCGTLLQCLRLMKPTQPEAIRTVIGLVMVTSISMMRMFGYTAYTVLYYRCKKSHGQEIELLGADLEYTKIPTAPLINEHIP